MTWIYTSLVVPPPGTHFLLLWPTYLTAAMMKAMTATPPIVPTMTAIRYFSGMKERRRYGEVGI